MVKKLKDAFNKAAEIKLVYRSKQKPEDRPWIVTTLDAYELFMQSWDMGKIDLQEECKVMLLDNHNQVLGIISPFTGGVTGCTTDLRIVFGAALVARATGIILAHNHPSGVPVPSGQDIALTDKFVNAGKLLDIKVLDHVVLGRDGFSSIAEQKGAKQGKNPLFGDILPGL